MTTSGNTKSTWTLAGKLAGSFTDSTKKAQSQLGQLRREYRANEGELKRLEAVMRRSAAGTDSYANASRQIPRLKDDLNSQALAISAVEKETLAGARAQDRMSNASGRAGAGLKGLASFGIAAGTGIGIAGAAVAGLVTSLNSAGREAQQLQALSTRGIDTDSYQRAASTMAVLTGNTQAARAAMMSAADSAQTIAENLRANPKAISGEQFRAAPMLGFDNIQAFADAGKNVEGMMKTIREQWKGANEGERLDMRWAARQLGIQESMIDAIAEQNSLYEKQAALLKGINAGNKGAVGDLKKVDAQIARINSGLGVMSKSEIGKAERYDEASQVLKQFGKDLRTNAAVATVDAFDFVQNPRRAYREGREREGQRSPSQELGGLSQEESKDAYQAAASAQRGRVPGFAQGGVVPGPEGRLQLAMVHGGERVLANRQARAFDDLMDRSMGPRAQTDRSTQHYDQRQQSTDRSRSDVKTMHNNFYIEASMEGVAQEVESKLQTLLATGVSW